MSKKKKHRLEDEGKKVNDALAPYAKKKSLVIFKSFEEQDEYNRVQMSKLTPLERLQQLRKMINVAYGMYGYNPDDLPTKHKLTIL